MKDDFLKRVLERRNSQQTSVDYLKTTPQEDSASNRLSWDGLGPKLPMYEDWMCRWCGEINRRRVGAERPASCKKCYKNMKPCSECGGPVNRVDADATGKPPHLCKECWKCY